MNTVLVMERPTTQFSTIVDIAPIVVMQQVADPLYNKHFSHKRQEVFEWLQRMCRPYPSLRLGRIDDQWARIVFTPSTLLQDYGQAIDASKRYRGAGFADVMAWLGLYLPCSVVVEIDLGEIARLTANSRITWRKWRDNGEQINEPYGLDYLEALSAHTTRTMTALN